MFRYITVKERITEEEREEIRRGRISEARDALEAAQAELDRAEHESPDPYKTVFVKIGPEDPRYESAPFEDQMLGLLSEARGEMSWGPQGSIFEKLIPNGNFPSGAGTVSRFIK